MGCSVILCSERPTPPLIAELFKRHKPTVFFAVPAVFRGLVEYARQGNQLETGSIKFCVSAGEVLPVAILIVVVLGSMYLGIVTPTEAAALGTMVSLVLAWWAGSLTWVAMRRAFEETVRTTSMVMAIIIFAAIFSHVIALIGAPKALLAYVVSLGLPKWAFFTAVFSFLLVIAYALEELSVMIILLPILFPLITGLGFDPVWFGIIMVVWLEIGFITPPVGLNLFVIQGLMPGSTARTT